MRPLIILIFLILSFLVYGFYLSQFELQTIPKQLAKENPSLFYDYRGISNVQTDLSAGSSSSSEVIAEAKKADLDFLIITDINQYESIENDNGYHDGLLVFSGSEFTYLDSRLLYYSTINRKIPKDPQTAQMSLTDMLSQTPTENDNDLLVLAHPFKGGQTWSGEYPLGLDGLEIINPKSLSTKTWDRSKLSVFWSVLMYPFNPQLAFLRLFHEPEEESILWDTLAKKRKTIGFAGADASARAIPWTDYLVKFPSYQRSFEIASNHVLLQSELTGDYQMDRAKLFNALNSGQFYIALDLLGDPKGFYSVVKDRDDVHPIGSKIKWNARLKLTASLPTAPRDFYEIVVYKNGERDFIVNTPQLLYDIKTPGIYRVVVRLSPKFPFPEGKRWLTWIYTNQFYID